VSWAWDPSSTKAVCQNNEQGQMGRQKPGFPSHAPESAADAMAAYEDAGAPRGNWNVIVSIFQDGFRRAIRALRTLGPIERSRYHNVLVMSVEDPVALLEAIERQTEADPALYDTISRVAPAARSFEFHSTEEFLARAKAIVMEWQRTANPRKYAGKVAARKDNNSCNIICLITG
jgi:hypothetical protein